MLIAFISNFWAHNPLIFQKNPSLLSLKILFSGVCFFINQAKGSNGYLSGIFFDNQRI